MGRAFLPVGIALIHFSFGGTNLLSQPSLSVARLRNLQSAAHCVDFFCQSFVGKVRKIHSGTLLCAKHSRELGRSRARVKSDKIQTETLPASISGSAMTGLGHGGGVELIQPVREGRNHPI